MIRLLYIAAFVLLFQGMLFAQPYKNAVGVRAGYSSGITFRHSIDRKLLVEGLALYNRHGFQFTALYGYQFSPYPKERLYYYGSAGLHVGNWQEELAPGAGSNAVDWQEEFALGAAIAVGSEFAFRDAPVIIGLEWKPMINIFRFFDFGIPDIAVTLRVSLN